MVKANCVDDFDSESFVYFIEAVGIGRIKIGCSADPVKRLSKLRLLAPVPLKIIALEEGGRFRESFLHNLLHNYRVHGEWFESDAVTDYLYHMSSRAICITEDE